MAGDWNIAVNHNRVTGPLADAFADCFADARHKGLVPPLHMAVLSVSGEGILLSYQNAGELQKVRYVPTSGLHLPLTVMVVDESGRTYYAQLKNSTLRDLH